jgi:hypothetical protein
MLRRGHDGRMGRPASRRKHDLSSYFDRASRAYFRSGGIDNPSECMSGDIKERGQRYFVLANMHGELARFVVRADGTLLRARKPHAANEKGGTMSLDEPKIEKALADFKAARQRLFVALNEEWLDDSEDCDDVAASSDVNLLANAFMRAASAAEDLVYSILHPSNREGAAQHADVSLDQASQLIRAVDFRGDQREAA